MKSNAWFSAGLLIAVRQSSCSGIRAVHNDYAFFAAYAGTAIHRARLRLEHPRRLCGIREFRHRRLLRSRRLYQRRHRQTRTRPHPAHDACGRRRLRSGRRTYGCDDAETPRRLLRHLHPRTRSRRAGCHHQLGLRRRLRRSLCRAAPLRTARRTLRRISVLPDAGARCPHRRPGPRHRAVPPRLRPRRHSRRRTRRREPGCPHLSPQADCDDAQRRANGHGRRGFAGTTPPISTRVPASP